jgi:hypothetical protein
MKVSIVVMFVIIKTGQLKNGPSKIYGICIIYLKTKLHVLLKLCFNYRHETESTIYVPLSRHDDGLDSAKRK